MKRISSDSKGDWFAFGIQFPGRQMDPIGAIRFRRGRSGALASIADNGITWTEYWDNNGSVWCLYRSSKPPSPFAATAKRR